eukprot:CAMPEP_0175830534 /NCGR_PEP_ID=MMETSP0107_2-20121207/13982_1 /TAXON_ID=195067 ORGANISM="Goniomonas pacifica, Strain CCMP1869" /NCGR_SAMPLE_ID=MMETSP0107_2 /ASSEMBLY_ACC=CAM_ASM_000203 /LENGTH=82 /DNA_ID=CAMNT_0017143511 /DNA_START=908 /DNA_END=1153 /DNA_ORIENTATION=-
MGEGTCSRCGAASENLAYNDTSHQSAEIEKSSESGAGDALCERASVCGQRGVSGDDLSHCPWLQHDAETILGLLLTRVQRRR